MSSSSSGSSHASASSASSHASGSSADPIIGKAALRQRPPEVTWQPGSRTVLVAVHLPTATSSAGLQLELATDTELHLSGASFGAVRIALPTAVLDEGTSAKFEKRSRVLRVRLPVAATPPARSPPPALSARHPPPSH